MSYNPRKAGAAHGYAKSSVSDKLSWDPTALSLDGIGIATLAIAAMVGVLFVLPGIAQALPDRRDA